MKSNPLKWHGGKSYLAKNILAIMPSHIHYVETHFGGGAVLFAKDPKNFSEVANDIDGELQNFWAVLRSRLRFDEFKHLCDTTPFSQEIFEYVKRTQRIEALEEGPSIEEAWKFFVRYRQSRQGLGKDFCTPTKTRTRRGMNEGVSSWLSAIDGLEEASKRLSMVYITNDDASKIIRSHDGPSTLFYCDPPYLHSTRSYGSKGAYACEMTVKCHKRLLDSLSSITGKFILSGYPSDLYDTYAGRNGWHKLVITIDNKASGAKVKPKKEECLWTNYNPGRYLQSL